MDDLDSAELRRVRMLWTSSARVSSQYCTSACMVCEEERRCVGCVRKS